MSYLIFFCFAGVTATGEACSTHVSDTGQAYITGVSDNGEAQRPRITRKKFLKNMPVSFIPVKYASPVTSH
jgi:hypothetical protein